LAPLSHAPAALPHALAEGLAKKVDKAAGFRVLSNGVLRPTVNDEVTEWLPEEKSKFMAILPWLTPRPAFAFTAATKANYVEMLAYTKVPLGPAISSSYAVSLRFTNHICCYVFHRARRPMPCMREAAKDRISAEHLQVALDRTKNRPRFLRRGG
jgi:hypothetical protein